MNLSSLGKQILTAAAIQLAFRTLGRLATRAELSRYVGAEHLDQKTAERYARLFAAEHGLKYRVEYDDQPRSSARVHLQPVSVLRGPSTAEAKRRLGRGDPTLSLDDPAVRMHEMGHVKDLAHRRPVRALAALAPMVAGGVAGAIGQRGHPWLAALTAMLGRVPTLVQEWAATRYAKEFLERKLPPEEARRVHGLLAAAFRSYVYDTAATGAATAVWQHLRPKLQARWDQA